MNEPKLPGRIVIIPFLHGKITADGKLSEPDIHLILQKWLVRHPEFRNREKEFRIVRGQMHLPGGVRTDLLRVTADFSLDLAAYDPAQDSDLYECFLADESGAKPASSHKIWIEQCNAARGIEAEFGTPQALDYLIGEKFLNFLEAADDHAEFRAELPAFVAEIKSIFELWQLAESIWRRLDRPSRSIPASTTKRTTTLSWSGDLSFTAVRPICCWSSGQRSGCWRIEWLWGILLILI